MSEPKPEPERLRPVSGEVRAPVGPTALDEELTFRALFFQIVRGKWIILATMAVLVGLVTVWMKTTEPLYTASMVIAPTGEAGAGGMAGRLLQYGDLASLAGINLPSAEAVSPFTQFTELVTSVTVAQRLQDKYGVLQKLFERSWDAENKRWLPPEGPVESVMGWVRGFFNLPAWTPPSATSFAAYLEDELEISEVARSGMRKIAFRHEDPEFAVRLLHWIHEESDELIREEAQERTTRQIEYIERKLATVSIIEHRQSLTQLLSDQEKEMMMIQVDLPFSARIIEPPTASDEPTFPKPELFLAISLVAGFFLGVFLVVLVGSLRGSVSPYDS